jgi:carbohydrate-binding DOMON domain-containing protein
MGRAGRHIASEIKSAILSSCTSRPRSRDRATGASKFPHSTAIINSYQYEYCTAISTTDHTTTTTNTSTPTNTTPNTTFNTGTSIRRNNKTGRNMGAIVQAVVLLEFRIIPQIKTFLAPETNEKTQIIPYQLRHQGFDDFYGNHLNALNLNT